MGEDPGAFGAPAPDHRTQVPGCAAKPFLDFIGSAVEDVVHCRDRAGALHSAASLEDRVPDERQRGVHRIEDVVFPERVGAEGPFEQRVEFFQYLAAQLAPCPGRRLFAEPALLRGRVSLPGPAMASS